MTAGPGSDKAHEVRAMFTRIARRYDLMNGLMTLGMHRRWRQLAATAALQATCSRQPAGKPGGDSETPTERAQPTPLPLALDIGAGTGDLSLALIRAGAARVVAADFSETMLSEARRKLSSAHGATSRLGFLPHPKLLPRWGGRTTRPPPHAQPDPHSSAYPEPCFPDLPEPVKRGVPSPPGPLPSPLGPLPSIDLLAADALHLPFPDDTFDCITNGFLLRNVAGLPETFLELHRVLRPGGRLVCLEITHPPRLIAPLFRPYFEGVVPLLGRIIAGDAAAYSYLPASVRPFPDARGLAGMLRNAGFVDVSYRRLSIGVVALHLGKKQSR